MQLTAKLLEARQHVFGFTAGGNVVAAFVEDHCTGLESYGEVVDEEVRRLGHTVKPVDAAPSDPVLVGKMLPGMWKMKSDLKRAGVEYVKDGRTAAFHALRNTLATNLAEMGAAPRTAMEIMRHSEMRLTMKTYTDSSVLPLADTINALPSFLPVKKEEEGHCTQIRTHDTGAERHDEAQGGSQDENGNSSKISDGEDFWRELAQMDAGSRVSEVAPEVGFELISA